jgi:16S rRNA (guanine966-N2)-methyltransferase
MRIISGVFKSRLLRTPGKVKNVRPTTDRARESLFNILSNRIDFNGITCLDLFCGTGSFGLECISRGAVKVFFIDTKTDIVEENIDALGVAGKSSVIQMDVLLFLKNFEGNEFDLSFADPPYNYNRYDKLMNEISRFQTVFILEHSVKFLINERYNENFFLQKELGKTNFSFLRFE